MGSRGKGNKFPARDLDAFSDILEQKLNEKLDAKFESLHDAINKLATEDEVERLKCSVRTNRFECDKLEQYTRRENCHIHNLSVASDTDFTEQVVDLFNHLLDLAAKDGSTETRVNADTARQSKPFCSSDISVCHPVKPKHGSKQQIIVRFVSRNKLYEVFRSKKYLKSSLRYKGVFITDDLTPLRMKLFDIVKKDGATSHNFGSVFVCVLLSGLFFFGQAVGHFTYHGVHRNKPVASSNNVNNARIKIKL